VIDLSLLRELAKTQRLLIATNVQDWRSGGAVCVGGKSQRDQNLLLLMPRMFLVQIEGAGAIA